jgi:hypothetical protein
MSGDHVGARQALAGALQGEPELVQQPRDVMVVVMDAEALPDQVADHRPGPHAALVASRHRARFDDRRQLRAMPSVRPAASTPGPEPAPAPSATPSATPPATPIEEAGRLRTQAFKDCVNNEWVKCQDALDSARELDPTGDKDPLVKAARKDALDGIKHLEDKYDTGWRPPRVRAYAPKP